ncbi:Mur ligase domain-containing protein, partial [Bacteroidota bacterium]
MELEKLNTIYLLGIGGIGMSALARFFKGKEKTVSGYDKTSTPLTSALISEGIKVHFKEQPELIPENTDLVIYTPAIPPDNKEFLHVKDNSFPLLKRSEVLGILTQSGYTIAVAGTHGKTTITSLITHLLVCSEKNPTAFVGGISKNINSNFITSDNSDIYIVEADEYDRSFLQLNPDIAIITSIDPDHLDVYKTTNYLHESFYLFKRQIKDSGTLIRHISISLPENNCKHEYTYGLTENADIFAKNILIQHG